MGRHPIEVKGLHHGPGHFPIAVRSGPLVVSSAIPGTNPDTGELSDTLEGQVAGVFSNIRRVIEAAMGSPDNIVKVVVFARDPAATRTALEGPWSDLFPDPSDRPVRHTIGAELPASLLIQAEFIAYLEETTQ
jgi:2-iminobutanoate/2-iminopropanoate deaminase